MNVLFINSCPRPRGVSRTLMMADAFVGRYKLCNPQDDVKEQNIFDGSTKLYTLEDINMRNDLLKAGRFDNVMFDNAVKFANADKIIIAAPYWDMSFPAMFKAYIESICVNGITFKYTETGSKGLALFKKLVYITTSGGYMDNCGYGSEYVEQIAGFLGEGEYSCVAAKGLDIVGNDVDAIIKDGIERAKTAAENF